MVFHRNIGRNHTRFLITVMVFICFYSEMGGSLLSHGGSPSHYGFKTKSWLFMTWIWGTTMTSERSIFRGTTLWKKDVLRGSIDDGNSEEVCNCLEILQVWACEVQIWCTLGTHLWDWWSWELWFETFIYGGEWWGYDSSSHHVLQWPDLCKQLGMSMYIKAGHPGTVASMCHKSRTEISK